MTSAAAAPQPVGERARELVREQLKNGPKPGAHIEAAAEAAEIPKRALIAAADALKVRTQRGQWWIPSRKNVALVLPHDRFQRSESV